MSVSAEDFVALARSSPWLWTTLRFTMHQRDRRWPDDPVRGRLRRPDQLRVEGLNGELRQIVHETQSRAALLTAEANPDFEPAVLADPAVGLPGAPRHQPAQRRADGLATARAHQGRTDYDAPMYRNYFWVAIFDPIELADGLDWDTEATLPGTEIEAVREVFHEARPAWEATLRPTGAYEPRCGCCSMLRSRAVDQAEWGDGYPHVLLEQYPTAYQVRLDRETGVCVYTEALGGDTAGAGHSLSIEAVDEPMSDELFVDQRPKRDQPGRRRFRWSAYPGKSS
ncbi:MAG: hypothetical protein ABI382_01675 [Nakamurella sp.]